MTRWLTRASFLLVVLVLSLVAPLRATIIPSEKEHVVSLDGTWRFRIERAAPTTAPSDFSQSDFREGDDWHDLVVPGNWEIAGYSPATYDQPDDAVGQYRLMFDVPADWQGRIVKINFDGVQNGAGIWLNGQPVKVEEPSWGRANYHEGGWTAWQADLTDAVRFGQKNLLALRVSKASKSADLDTGDYFFLGGIHRPVTLFSVPGEANMRDLTVTTKLLDGGKAQVAVDVEIAGRNVTVVSRLEGADTVSAKPQSGHAVVTHLIDQPRLWSAENPNLYTLSIELRDRENNTTERVARRVGVREVSIKDGVFLLNGVPIKLAGICRHDVFPSKGTAVDEEVWRKDLELMRQANINCVRTSHYPYGSRFYDLCDEMGFYVIDELPYCWCPTDQPDLFPAFLQRARETVARDKNHACAIIWGIGNENKAGEANQLVADLVKKLDPTRPRLVSRFGAAKYDTELSDSHYTTPAEIEKAAARARENGHPHIYTENPNVWDVRLGADPGCWDRWAEVMRRTWDVVAREDTIVGTCPWEWQDRAIADKNPVKNYEFDPATGIHYLKTKGMVDGWRHPRPELWHVKMIYSPIQVEPKLDVSSTPTSAVLDVTNRYSFTDLSQLDTAWKLSRDGNDIASGAAHPALAPRTRGKVKLDLPQADADMLRINFAHPIKGNVTTVQFVLKEKPESVPIADDLPKDFAFPTFNLVTHDTHADKAKWRVCIRKRGRLINARREGTTLEADVAVGEDDAAIGHVRATLDKGQFSYHLNWSGKKVDVQELGWTFALPTRFDHFSWKRLAPWSFYPDTHIGRPRGTATPDSAAGMHITNITRPDAFDFVATKYDCDWATLSDADAASGLAVAFTPEQRHHVKAAILDGGAGYALVVNRQCSPPSDISTPTVRDLYLALSPGGKIEGHFRVGAVQLQAAAGSPASAGRRRDAK